MQSTFQCKVKKNRQIKYMILFSKILFFFFIHISFSDIKKFVNLFDLIGRPDLVVVLYIQTLQM